MAKAINFDNLLYPALGSKNKPQVYGIQSNIPTSYNPYVPSQTNDYINYSLQGQPQVNSTQPNYFNRVSNAYSGSSNAVSKGAKGLGTYLLGSDIGTTGQATYKPTIDETAQPFNVPITTIEPDTGLLGSIGNGFSSIVGQAGGYDKDGTFTPATGLGGTRGIADIGGGLASLYSIYSGIQANDRAEQAWNLQKGEYNRGVQKDKDFATNIAKSGLGSYSAGA